MDKQGWKSLGHAVLKVVVACALAAGIPYGAYALYRHYSDMGAFIPQNVTIHGNVRESDAAIFEASGFGMEDANLAEMDIHTVEASIETLPWVREASVTVELPNTAHIHVTEYEPLGIINDGTLSLIDETGAFIKYWRDDDELTAPIVTLDAPLAERTSEAIKAFEIASLAHKKGYSKKIHEISYDKGVGFTLFTKTGSVLLGYEQFDARLDRLLDVERLLEERRVVAQYILLDGDNALERVVVKPQSVVRSPNTPVNPSPNAEDSSTKEAQNGTILKNAPSSSSASDKGTANSMGKASNKMLEKRVGEKENAAPAKANSAAQAKAEPHLGDEKHAVPSMGGDGNQAISEHERTEEAQREALWQKRLETDEEESDPGLPPVFLDEEDTTLPKKTSD